MEKNEAVEIPRWVQGVREELESSVESGGTAQIFPDEAAMLLKMLDAAEAEGRW